MENYLLILAATLSLLGLGCLGRYFYLTRKAKEQKPFTVIALSLLAVWFFGGSALMVIGTIIFTLMIWHWIF